MQQSALISSLLQVKTLTYWAEPSQAPPTAGLKKQNEIYYDMRRSREHAACQTEGKMAIARNKAAKPLNLVWNTDFKGLSTQLCSASDGILRSGEIVKSLPKLMSKIGFYEIYLSSQYGKPYYIKSLQYRSTVPGKPVRSYLIDICNFLSDFDRALPKQYTVTALQ